jgi:hypothetical protein
MSELTEFTALKAIYMYADVPVYIYTFIPPSFIIAENQVGRAESYLGEDGINILPSVNDQEQSTNAHTVGESISSIRPMMLRYGPETNVTSKVLNGKTYFVIDCNTFAAISRPSPSYTSFFAPCFRFYSGSRRYKFFITTPSGDYVNKIDAVYLVNDKVPDKAISDPYLKMYSTNLYHRTQEGSFEVTVPYYNRNRLSIVGDITSENLLSPIPRYIYIETGDGSTTDKSIRVFSNIGEDFQFGAFLSTPTLVPTSKYQ